MSYSVSEVLIYSHSQNYASAKLDARDLGAGYNVRAQVSYPHFVNMLSYLH